VRGCTYFNDFIQRDYIHLLLPKQKKIETKAKIKLALPMKAAWRRVGWECYCVQRSKFYLEGDGWLIREMGG
jgi:hypothetical protein